MIANYIRVSTTEQNTNRQENTITGATTFTDKISGSFHSQNVKRAAN
jgi:DNA invertase Pin-like site-specific DNA recombinase